jgi:FG-GAP-like repeat
LRSVIPALTLASAVVVLSPAAAVAAPGDLARVDETPLGNTPYELTTQDFNEDGNVDVAAANANGSSVSIVLGDGEGNFAPAPTSTITTGTSPLGIASADFNGDSHIDLAVVQAQAQTVRILLGGGDGTFTAAAGEPATGASPRDVQAAELSGDTNVDLAVTNRGNGADPGTVSILLGNGSGGFAAAGTSPETVGVNPFDIAIADLNGAGGKDIAVANSISDNVSILLGNGAGDFTAGTAVVAGDGADAIAAEKLDDDAAVDLATSNAFGENTSILLNDGAAAFTTPMTSPEPEGGNSGIGAGDLDGDDDSDLVVTQGNEEVAPLENDGSGDFSSPAGSIATVHGIATKVALADTDNDSDLDVLVSGGNGGDFRLTSLVNDAPDADGDHVADSIDECPSLAAPQGCPQLSRTISAVYKPKRKAFKGAIESATQACVGPGQRVRLIKLTGQGDKLLAKAKTDATGAYKLKLKHRARRGTYRVDAPESADPELGTCLFTTVYVSRP